MHLATAFRCCILPSTISKPFLPEGTMKFRLEVILAGLLLSAVPIALAQDAATDVKKGAEKTGHETKVVAKDTAKGTEKGAKATGHATKKVAKVVGKDTEKG